MANRQIKYEPHIIDNLTSTSTSDALSANQGKVLNEGVYEKTTFSLNLPSGYSFEQGHSYKLGNLVYIGGVLVLPSATTAKRVSITECIPNAFRTLYRIDFAAHDNSSDNQLHGIMAGSNTGMIDFYRPDTYSLQKIAFSVVYPII